MTGKRKCHRCENEFPDYRLSDYLVTVESPDQKLFEREFKDLCSTCLEKLTDHIRKFWLAYRKTERGK